MPSVDRELGILAIRASENKVWPSVWTLGFLFLNLVDIEPSLAILVLRFNHLALGLLGLLRLLRGAVRFVTVDSTTLSALHILRLRRSGLPSCPRLDRYRLGRRSLRHRSPIAHVHVFHVLREDSRGTSSRKSRVDLRPLLGHLQYSVLLVNDVLVLGTPY